MSNPPIFESGAGVTNAGIADRLGSEGRQLNCLIQSEQIVDRRIVRGGVLRTAAAISSRPAPDRAFSAASVPAGTV
jgi:hypothetical protein